MTTQSNSVLLEENYPKTKVWNSLNAQYRPKNYMVNTMPDMCVPDQNMSLKEIVQRYTNHLPITGKENPLFNDDENALGIDARSLDLTELHDMAKDTRETISKAQQQLQKQEADKKAKEHQKMIDDTVEARLQEKLKNTNTP